LCAIFIILPAIGHTTSQNQNPWDPQNCSF